MMRISIATSLLFILSSDEMQFFYIPTFFILPRTFEILCLSSTHRINILLILKKEYLDQYLLPHIRYSLFFLIFMRKWLLKTKQRNHMIFHTISYLIFYPPSCSGISQASPVQVPPFPIHISSGVG